MTNDPDDRSSDQPDDDKNPFRGTPFEQIFAAFGGNLGAGAGAGGLGGPGMAGLPDLMALLGPLQQMMGGAADTSPGFVNWEMARNVARQAVATDPDPVPGAGDISGAADAIRLADHWLDQVTDFPSGVTAVTAWSRAEWVEETIDVWRGLVEPVAEHVVTAMTEALPPEAKAMAGPLMGLLGKAGGAMFGTQVGQGLGGLAGEVLTASDIGLPLGPTGKAALVPTNVATFAGGLDVGYDDVLLYLALREAAHQRLFAHVPWLRAHVLTAVEDYGRGMSIDVGAIEAKLSQINPMDPASMQEAMSGGLFELDRTPAQEAALNRLETLLALVEGWVDEVVGQATETRMPSAGKLQEAVRRRRAAGGPAESTFAALVGLELRPRRLRDASTLWGSLRSRQGTEARDSVWQHPDLLPTAADLDDPLGFREDTPEPVVLSDEAFDAELAQLLGSDTPDSTDQPSDEPPRDPAA